MPRARLCRCTRRRFLARAAVGLAAAGHVVGSSALGRGDRPPPSERVVIGYIGTGGRGMHNIREQLPWPEAQLVAVCDTWTNRRDGAKRFIDRHYGNIDCRAYVDFREVLGRSDIDAVGIATPDHWHVPIAVAAMRAGKDVHVEKPLGISIAEDLACRDAARRTGRVVQYGAESRSWPLCRFGAELVRSGRVGRLREIRVKAPNSVSGGSTAPRPVPPGLAYDLWLGPAPWRPYSGCPDGGGAWYHVRDYALGFIAGWAAHPLDLMVWAYDGDRAGPWQVEGTAVIPAEGRNDAVMNWDVRIRFGDGVPVRFQAWGVEPETEPKLARLGNYVQFIGTEGWIALCYRGLVAEPESLLRSRIGPGEVHLPRSSNHEGNFIHCVRTRQRTVDPIEDAVRSDLLSQVSEIACRLGRKIVWDPDAERFVGDPEASRLASRLASRAHRAPWQV
ncbi:MAG: Gfo/Idh/MocA family oxidoreductase [Planctomycetota bacterium]|nr:Gfo/Idh/MocA family oxidoreductase [Planctomycetota bacterium]